MNGLIALRRQFHHKYDVQGQIVSEVERRSTIPHFPTFEFRAICAAFLLILFNGADAVVAGGIDLVGWYLVNYEINAKGICCLIEGNVTMF